jgi:hypothetical protein
MISSSSHQNGSTSVKLKYIFQYAIDQRFSLCETDADCMVSVLFLVNQKSITGCHWWYQILSTSLTLTCSWKEAYEVFSSFSKQLVWVTFSIRTSFSIISNLIESTMCSRQSGWQQCTPRERDSDSLFCSMASFNMWSDVERPPFSDATPPRP